MHHAEVEAVGKILDDFHDAAPHGDKKRYLDHMFVGKQRSWIIHSHSVAALLDSTGVSPGAFARRYSDDRGKPGFTGFHGRGRSISVLD